MKRALTIAIALGLFGSLCTAGSFQRSRGWQLTLEIDAAPQDRERLVKQTVQIMRTRLDGVNLPHVAVEVKGAPADGRIVVRSASLDSGTRERINSIVTSEGKLELVHVISPPSPNEVQTFKTEDAALASLGASVPANRRVLLFDTGLDQSPRAWVVVEAPAIIDGRDLQKASAVPSVVHQDGYQIAFTLKPEAAEKFGAWTGRNIYEYIGIVFNREVKSIAYIKSQIFGEGQISGKFTKEAAEDLAQVLNSGPLPARVRIIHDDAK